MGRDLCRGAGMNDARPAESSVESFQYLVRLNDQKRLNDWLAKRPPEEKAFFESCTRASPNPLFLSNKNNALQRAKSGSSIPLNVLGGYRWPGAVPIESELLRKVTRARSEEHTSELQSLRHLVC